MLSEEGTTRAGNSDNPGKLVTQVFGRSAFTSNTLMRSQKPIQNLAKGVGYRAPLLRVFAVV